MKPKRQTRPQTALFPTAANSKTPVTLVELDQEAIQQFEIELIWCIQHLQNALNGGKLKPHQAQDHMKALKTLTNKSAPMPKKRQVMRLALGDYRAAMAAEKFPSVPPGANVKPIAANKNSVFFKKSTTKTDFKFNFPQIVNNEETQPEEATKIMETESPVIKSSKEKMNFKLIPSNNEFKFNFNLDENEEVIA